MRTYKNSSGRRNAKIDPVYFERAITDVRNKAMSIRKASEVYAIPFSTLKDRVNGRYSKTYGGQTVLSEDEEAHLVKVILTCADWNQPLTRKDVMLIVQNYLNKIGKSTRFVDNLPGADWWYAFKKRHPLLSEKFAQNIKRCRALVGTAAVSEFFTHLKETCGCTVREYH